MPKLMPKKSRKSLCEHAIWDEFSQVDLSPDSECFSHSVELPTVRSRKRLAMNEAKRDYLSRLFQKKKLKEKSLSKKLHTPFDRKLDRTCWPIEMRKISKIKKKPKEKKKKKPHYKSLRKKNVSKSILITHLKKSNTNLSGCSSEADAAFEESIRNFNPVQFVYEPVTPQMLMDVLQEPKLLKWGATLDTIAAKLRTLKSELNPTMEMLKEEVSEKLRCAIKLGMVIESDGYYTLVNRFKTGKLPRKKVDAFWDLWRRKPAKPT